jgi:hypothetical protein
MGALVGGLNPFELAFDVGPVYCSSKIFDLVGSLLLLVSCFLVDWFLPAVQLKLRDGLCHLIIYYV